MQEARSDASRGGEIPSQGEDGMRRLAKDPPLTEPGHWHAAGVLQLRGGTEQ